MKYYNQCPNCGEIAHVSGCMSNKCILDGLRNALRITEAHVAELKKRIADAEARMAQGTKANELTDDATLLSITESALAESGFGTPMEPAQ